jgi:hypothetical protein
MPANQTARPVAAEPQLRVPAALAVELDPEWHTGELA